MNRLWQILQTPDLRSVYLVLSILGAMAVGAGGMYLAQGRLTASGETASATPGAHEEHEGHEEH